jgi:hypothetical protein
MNMTKKYKRIEGMLALNRGCENDYDKLCM